MLLDGNRLFEMFKGVLTGEYPLQWLKTMNGLNIYYWTADRVQQKLIWPSTLDAI